MREGVMWLIVEYGIGAQDNKVEKVSY